MEEIQGSFTQILALICFVGAVVHSFFAHRFVKQATLMDQQGESGSTAHTLSSLCGHLTFIFTIWLLPLILYMWVRAGGNGVNVLMSNADLREPFANFAFIFLALSPTVRRFFNAVVAHTAERFGGSAVAYWISCFTLGILLDGVLSEAAVVVLVANALIHRFMDFQPSEKFTYTTLAVLMVALALGGIVLPFNITASLDLSSEWGWTHWTVLQSLSLRVLLVLAVLLASTALYLRDEFAQFTARPDLLPLRFDKQIAGYLLAFLFAGYFKEISFFLVALVGCVCVLERDDRGLTQTERLHLPLLIALFNYSMEIYAFLLGGVVGEIYGVFGGSAAPVATFALSAMNQHIPGAAFITTLASAPLSIQNLALLALAAGGGVTLFANAVNILAYKLLQPYFPGAVVISGRVVLFALPMALGAYILLWMSFLVI